MGMSWPRNSNDFKPKLLGFIKSPRLGQSQKPAGTEVMKRTELRDAGANDRRRDAEMGCPCNRPQLGKGVQSSTEDGVNIKCSG